MKAVKKLVRNIEQLTQKTVQSIGGQSALILQTPGKAAESVRDTDLGHYYRSAPVYMYSGEASWQTLLA